MESALRRCEEFQGQHVRFLVVTLTNANQVDSNPVRRGAYAEEPGISDLS